MGNLATVNPGDNLRFVIEIFNQGVVPAANIEVTITFLLVCCWQMTLGRRLPTDLPARSRV